MKTVIIANPTPNNINEIIKINQDDYVVAVDGAYLECLNQNIKVDFIIGDFDSLTNYEKLIENVEHQKLDENKDYSDTYYAVEHSQKKTPNNQIYLLGGIGGDRFEHTYANILLLINNPNLIVLTEKSEIRLLNEGECIVKYNGYINLFAVTPSNVTLKGFKYNLNEYKLMPNNPLGLSNELLEDKGNIIISKGKIILIKTKYSH
ncbi:MAG: thiamine diphosphokinase [Acholeplasmataceae bacterium]